MDRFIPYYLFLFFAFLLAANGARAWAVLRARADESGAFADVARRDIVTFNSPFHLARDLGFFGSVALRSGLIAKLALLFVAGMYAAMVTMLVILILAVVSG
jgi:hypothetical protein